MKFGVLKYPGGHGDAELMHVLRNYFGLDAREVWYREPAYPDIGVLFIGGGFPCDNKESGADCLDESPAIQHLEDYTFSGGLVIGIGNGFRLLCDIGLLPGSLVQNVNRRYICRQVYFKPDNQLTPLTAGLSPDSIYRSPIATDHGRYDAPEEVLVSMRQEGQILFRYCDQDGRITESVNYTGSRDNIAGICNRDYNVFGIIPQPERAVTEFGHKADGVKIIQSLLDQLAVS